MSNMRLGKLPAKVDARTLKLKSILRVEVLPPLPDTFDVDDHLGTDFPERMFANDNWGDCVIAGRAHWTLRAEEFEQNRLVSITDQDVLDEYWAEQGYTPGKYKCALCRWLARKSPPDEGLYMLDSLKVWRRNGWPLEGNKYDIYAFAELDHHDHTDLCYSVMLLHGGHIGIKVPQSAIQQFNYGQPWSVVPGSPIEGGHAIYIVGYNPNGPVCVTWGRKQQMTWEFYDEYVDESYAVVDNMNAFMENSPVDVEKLNAYLESLKG